MFALPALCSLFTVSCINEEYNLERIDTTVKFFEEYVAFPLGRTEQLKLSTLLSEEDFKYLTTINGNVYALTISDKIDFSDKIPDLSAGLDIKPVSIEKKMEYPIDEINLDGLAIEGQSFSKKLEFKDMDISDKLTVPNTNIGRTIPTGISDYTPTKEQLTLDYETKTVLYDNIFDFGFHPAPDPDASISIPDNTIQLGDRTVSVNVMIELPEGISSIDQIKLNRSSQLVITTEIVNSFLTSGSIVPDMTVNVGEVVSLMDVPTNIIPVDYDYTLSSGNDYRVSHYYTISDLAVSKDDWNGNKLQKSASIYVGGSLSLSGASTTTNDYLMSEHNGGMNINVTIAFQNMTVDDFSATVDPVQGNINETFALDMEPVELPEEVTGVEEVRMKQGSKIVIGLEGSGISELGDGVDAEVSSLKISFPKEIVSPDLNENNELVIDRDIDIAAGYYQTVRVQSLKPGAPVDNQIVFGNDIKCSASYSIGGQITLSKLPDPANDPKVVVKAETNLVVDDYSVKINKIEKDLSQEPYDIDIDLPDGVGEIGTFNIYPAATDNAAAKFNISMPELQDVALNAGAEGIKITFPEFFVFKNVAADYNFNKEENSITLKDNLLEPVSLDIDHIRITPEKKEDNTYYEHGQILLEGHAVVGDDTDENIISGTEVSALVADGVEITASVSGITADKVSFERFEKELTETIAFDLFNTDDLPAELKSLSEVDFYDSEMSVEMNFTGLPDMGKPYTLELAMKFPEEFTVAGDNIGADNVLNITKQIDAKDNKFTIGPISIQKVDMTGVDLSAGGVISKDIAIDGSIYVEIPTVEPADLSGVTVSVNVVGGADINIAKATGIVDYHFDDMKQEIALDELPEFMKNEDFVLDFANPYITLKTVSNLGIPVKGDVEIIPYKDNAPMEDASVVLKDVVFPAAASADEPLTTNYWISADGKGMPGDYTLLQADLSSLLKRLPDNIEFNIKAGTDTDESNPHIVEPEKKYAMELAYDVVVPMEFGEELSISFADTLEGLDPVIGTLLELNELELAGNVVSTLPLELKLNVILLDSQSNVIPMPAEASQIISACNSDGSAASTPLDLKLTMGNKAEAAMRLQWS